VKKYIIYILIIISYGNAQNIIADKNNFIVNYKTALENFKIKKYDKTYTILYSLFQQKPDNLNINFYLGRSAYETKRYQEAILAYERFLFNKPTNSRVKLEMARSYFMVKEYKESKKLFLEVKNDKQIPPNTLLIIEKYLNLIHDTSSNNSVNGIIMVGTLYDSNINNRSIHNTFSDTYFPAADTYIDVTNTTEGVSNWYNQEIALINHKYKITDNITFKNNFLIFNKDSFDDKHDSTKLTLASYTPAVSINHTDKLTIDYALYTDFLSYGGKSKLKTFALFPKFQYTYNSTNKISGYFKYQRKEDLQDETQDKEYIESRFNLQHIFSKTTSLTSRITIADEKAQDTNEEGIDYSNVKGFLALNYKLLPTLTFTPNLSYTISKYHNIDPNYLIKKTNKQIKLGLTSTYLVTPRWILQQNIEYTKQQSNIDLNEYNKYTFGLNIIRTF